MILDFYKIPDFKTFITEKTGVIERNIYTEIDEKDTSRIIKKFMSKIINKPDDDYETQEMMFNELVTLKYVPTPNCKTYGMTGKKIIYIYKRVDSNCYLDVKYTLAHELVHMIHQILSKNERPYEDLSVIEKIRYLLVKVSSENMEEHDSKNLTLLLYLIDKNEVFSRNQNAYIKAFKYKKENPDVSNQEIISDVLDEIRMSKKYLNVSIKELKTNDSSFSYVISFLVGNFFEFGKSGFQQYFDKSVFEIPIIKKMRKEVKNVIHNCFNIDNTCEDILDIIRKYKNELDKHKEKITNTFIEHMEYWFMDAQKRIGKAIQLGIDDAIE